MKMIILFFIVLLFNFIADFHLQGILANLKQKEYWKENYPDKLYKNDWIVALIIHSLEWSIIIHIPLMYFDYINKSAHPVELLLVSIIINAAIHAIIDHIKANLRMINLTTDQLIHFLQILLTLLIYQNI